jgi:hypothetical protein
MIPDGSGTDNDSGGAAGRTGLEDGPPPPPPSSPPRRAQRVAKGELVGLAGGSESAASRMARPVGMGIELEMLRHRGWTAKYRCVRDAYTIVYQERGRDMRILTLFRTGEVDRVFEFDRRHHFIIPLAARSLVCLSLLDAWRISMKTERS